MANGDLFAVAGYRGGVYPRGSYSKKSYRYIKKDDKWEMKSDVKAARTVGGQSCARVINSKTGKEEVVVAGGWHTTGPPPYSPLSSTEIYTVESDTWRQGQPLPKAMWGHAFIPYEDQILLLGGSDRGACQPLDSIYDSIYQVG